MLNPINNVFNNIKKNKFLLYTTIFYVCILFFLLLLLYYAHSNQKPKNGLQRVTPPRGSIGVDYPKDA